VSKPFTHVLKAQQKISLTAERLQLAKKFLNTVFKRVKTRKVAVIKKDQGTSSFSKYAHERRTCKAGFKKFT
jgi:hypothetical protein